MWEQSSIIYLLVILRGKQLLEAEIRSALRGTENDLRPAWTEN